MHVHVRTKSHLNIVSVVLLNPVIIVYHIDFIEDFTDKKTGHMKLEQVWPCWCNENPTCSQAQHWI